MACRVDRRSFLRKSLAAGAAAAVIRGPEEQQLMAMLQNPSSPGTLGAGSASKMPAGKIGDLTISRLIAGGNIISGWCHQRDLLYVSTLAGHYLTREKQFDTLELMEERVIKDDTIGMHTSMSMPIPRRVIPLQGMIIAISALQ